MEHLNNDHNKKQQKTSTCGCGLLPFSAVKNFSMVVDVAFVAAVVLFL